MFFHFCSNGTVPILKTSKFKTTSRFIVEKMSIEREAILYSCTVCLKEAIKATDWVFHTGQIRYAIFGATFSKNLVMRVGLP